MIRVRGSGSNKLALQDSWILRRHSFRRFAWSSGNKPAEIAAALGISKRTVMRYLAR